MKEQDYIIVSDLAYIRMAGSVLYKCSDEDVLRSLKPVFLALQSLEEDLSKTVDGLMDDEA